MKQEEDTSSYRTWTDAADWEVRNAVGLAHIDARCSGEVEKTAPSDRICGVVVSSSASEVRLASLQTCGDAVGRRQQTAAERVAVYVRGPRGAARLCSKTPQTQVGDRWCMTSLLVNKDVMHFLQSSFNRSIWRTSIKLITIFISSLIEIHKFTFNSHLPLINIPLYLKCLAVGKW